MRCVGSYDFDTNRLLPGIELDQRLHGLRDQVRQWTAMPSCDLVHVLMAEYAPGTQLGWHRDMPDFETIVRFSLGGIERCASAPNHDEPAACKVVEL